MKTLVFVVVLTGALFASTDKQGEKFADQHRVALRKSNHIAEQWVAYCKGKDMVPDQQYGCAIKQIEQLKSIEQPVPQQEKK